MRNIFKKKQEDKANLSTFSSKVQELNEAELKKVMGGGNGGDTGTTTDPNDPTPDGATRVRSHSNAT